MKCPVSNTVGIRQKNATFLANHYLAVCDCKDTNKNRNGKIKISIQTVLDPPLPLPMEGDEVHTFNLPSPYHDNINQSIIINPSTYSSRKTQK